MQLIGGYSLNAITVTPTPTINALQDNDGVNLEDNDGNILEDN